MLKTCHEWIGKLASGSDLIAEMQLGLVVDNNAALNTDASNLANCDAHCRMIVRAIEELITRGCSSKENARDLLRKLIQRGTYGAFAELAAYDWLTRCDVKFTTQVPLTASDVLATNGSILDGKMDYSGFWFEAKSFGFNGRLAQRLKDRLAFEFPDEQVLVEGSWDIPIEDFSDLITAAPVIATELRQRRQFQKGRLFIRLERKKPVTLSMRTVEPYRLDKENALYPFQDAKQFTRNAPFILIFIVHPWFNALTGSGDKDFTRSLARRAFMQFVNDSTRLDSICMDVPSDVTLAEA